MTVLVTGAAGAIGGAIVERFAQLGEDVLAFDLREPSFAHDNVISLAGDLRSSESLTQLRKVLPDSGATAVIAAHGTFRGAGAVESLDLAVVAELIDINFSVVPHLLDASLDALRAAKGVFIAISSQAGLRGEPGASTYSASKWAVRAWAEASDERLRSEGVRIRCICPGRTKSPLLDNALDELAKAEGMSRTEYEEACLRLIPARRFGSPDLIAVACEYLAYSTDAPQTLAITGGEVPW